MSGANSVDFSAAAIAFDRVAASYDEVFTRTAIGKAQRAQVWSELLKAFATTSRILELNCGTGEDARFLAQRGLSIVACDASAEMVKVAETHSVFEAGTGSIRYLQLANEDLACLVPATVFDGAFSNFSGLNCVEDLKPVARNLASLVRPGGRLLICLWSRCCVMEMLWFLLHGQIKKAFRRFTGSATARLGGLNIAVQYPAVASVREAFAPWFRLEARRAIGLFVPPSYLEPWAQKHPGLLARLEKLDHAFARWSVLRDIGDHVLLELVRCPQ